MRSPYRIVFLMALLVLVVAMVNANDSVRHIETGTKAVSIPIGSFSASSTVTFASAFTTAPQVATTLLTSPLNIGGAPSPLFSFLSVESAGAIWAAMPVASTEIFGDALGEHRLQVDLSNFGFATFAVSCSAGPTLTTFPSAYLRPEYSIDGGATWNQLAATNGAFDANVDDVTIGGLCGGGTPSGVGVGSIAAAAQTFPVILRIVGFGGDGVTNLTVQQIMLQLYTVTSTMTCAVTSTSATSFLLRVAVSLIVANAAFTVTCRWIAT